MAVYFPLFTNEEHATL